MTIRYADVYQYYAAREKRLMRQAADMRRVLADAQYLASLRKIVPLIPSCSSIPPEGHLDTPQAVLAVVR